MNRLKRKAKLDARASKKAEESFYDQLLTDLFSLRWEWRHGAAIALACGIFERGTERAEGS